MLPTIIPSTLMGLLGFICKFRFITLPNAERSHAPMTPGKKRGDLPALTAATAICSFAGFFPHLFEFCTQLFHAWASWPKSFFVSRFSSCKAICPMELVRFEARHSNTGRMAKKLVLFARG